MRKPHTAYLVALTLWLPAVASAGSIETSSLEGAWPGQWVREFEVGRYPVRWRQRADDANGIFSGIRFDAPLPRDAVWRLATDYSDLGKMSPEVYAVRYLEQTPERYVLQVDLKVLWKTLTLTFVVEQEPPEAIRFRVVSESVGEYLGWCTFAEAPAMPRGDPDGSTRVELLSRLRPPRPVPAGLILVFQRMVLVRGVREFLEACESQLPEEEQVPSTRRRRNLLHRPGRPAW